MFSRFVALDNMGGSAAKTFQRRLPVHKYDARISWSRDGATFSGGRYSRGHEWSFDGGVKLTASASPSHVPAPYSIVEAVDPEEALVAAASSCHMLMFLWLAAKRGVVVDSYVDEAFGVMTTGHDGKLSFSRITLRPQVRFSPNAGPGLDEIAALHHAAHDNCYVANSLKCDVVVEAASPALHTSKP
jgi:organic hydroperoxide reductase OsmC/OhrA